MSYDVKRSTDLLFRFITIHAFDRQIGRWTDRRTDGQMSIARPCVCIRSRTVKRRVEALTGLDCSLQIPAFVEMTRDSCIGSASIEAGTVEMNSDELHWHSHHRAIRAYATSPSLSGPDFWPDYVVKTEEEHLLWLSLSLCLSVTPMSHALMIQGIELCFAPYDTGICF